MLQSGARLVIMPMAWLTQELQHSFISTPKEPDIDTLLYWVSRFEPLIRAESNQEVILVFANRAGTETTATYAGSSAVCGIVSGEVRVYGILGRGETELLVVDTDTPPYAKLVLTPPDAAAEQVGTNTESSPVAQESEPHVNGDSHDQSESSHIDDGTIENGLTESFHRDMHISNGDRHYQDRKPAQNPSHWDLENPLSGPHMESLMSDNKRFSIQSLDSLKLYLKPPSPPPKKKQPQQQWKGPEVNEPIMSWLDSVVSSQDAVPIARPETIDRSQGTRSKPRVESRSSKSRANETTPAPRVSNKDQQLAKRAIQNSARQGPASTSTRNDRDGINSDRPGSRRQYQEDDMVRESPNAREDAPILQPTTRSQLGRRTSSSGQHAHSQSSSRPAHNSRTASANETHGPGTPSRGRQGQERPSSSRATPSNQQPPRQTSRTGSRVQNDVDLAEYTMIEDYPSASCPLHGQPGHSHGPTHTHGSRSRSRTGQSSHSRQKPVKTSRAGSRGGESQGTNRAAPRSGRAPEMDPRSQRGRQSTGGERPDSSLDQRRRGTRVEIPKDIIVETVLTSKSPNKDPKTPIAMVLISEMEESDEQRRQRLKQEAQATPTLKCVERMPSRTLRRSTSAVW